VILLFAFNLYSKNVGNRHEYTEDYLQIAIISNFFVRLIDTLRIITKKGEEKIRWLVKRKSEIVETFLLVVFIAMWNNVNFLQFKKLKNQFQLRSRLFCYCHWMPEQKSFMTSLNRRGSIHRLLLLVIYDSINWCKE